MTQNRHAILPIALLSGGLGAAIGFALLARKVSAHETRQLDARARKRFPRRRRRLTRAVATAISPLGKWYGQAPLAALATAAVWRARGPRAAVPIATASAAAASLAWITERGMRQRKPPPGRHSPTEPSFPSGHALQTAALSWTTAFVLVREGLVTPRAAVPLAVALPLASGLGKLYLDSHWLTDVLGGYLLGGAIAAVAAAGHDLARPTGSPRIRRALARLSR